MRGKGSFIILKGRDTIEVVNTRPYGERIHHGRLGSWGLSPISLSRINLQFRVSLRAQRGNLIRKNLG